MQKSVYTDEYKILLDRLREARVNAGFTQLQVAKRLGKHQSFISKIESGERRIDVVELARLATVYTMSLDLVLSDITTSLEAKQHDGKIKNNSKKRKNK